MKSVKASKSVSLFLSMLLMPCFCLAFTVTTRPVNTTIYNPSAAIPLQKSVFFVKIDSSVLAKNYPWHNGHYFFYPYELIPIINESELGRDLTLLQQGRPKVSFDVKYIDRGTDNHNLDCYGGVGFRSFHSAGETQRCDGGPKANNGRKQGRIEYRINSIKQPTLVERTVNERFQYVWKDTQNPEIVIDFDVRFRIDEGTGAGGNFTPWFSTQEQINSYAAGLPPSQGTTGPGTQPPVVVLPTNCDACSSIIQCLACLQYNFVSSLKRVW
ncbi:MAG: hypothetical protein QW400_03425 [Candidatus Diapherotrites archaeon]